MSPTAADIHGDGRDGDCDGADGPSRRPDQVWSDPSPASQEVGFALAVGADLDRDGRTELTVGGPGLFSYPHYTDAFLGHVYQLETLNAPIGTWTGVDTGVTPGVFPFLGVEVSSGGDTDRDGFGEILVSSRWTSTDRQGAYLIRNLSTPLADTVVFEEELGWRMHDLAFSDIDGDEQDEVVLLAGSEGGLRAGVNHLFLLEAPDAGRVLLDDHDFLKFSDERDIAIALAVPGDFDADGAADLLLARSDGADRLGTIYGCSAPSWSGIAEGDALCPDRWEGEHLDSHAGDRLEAGGDLDGDGREDALVGSIFFNADEHHLGRAYILTEPLGGGVRSLAEAHAHLTGEVREDRVGMGLHGPGDVTGDGNDDMLLGAASYWFSDYNPGRVYLFAGPIAPGALDPADAMEVFAGTDPYGLFGATIASGDLDGDGLTDLVFGAPFADYGNGAIYMVPGSTL